MANISSGTSLTASGFNGLLTRLDAVRKNHKGKDGQNSTANNAFGTAFTTSVAVKGNAVNNANVQNIKNALTTLDKSEWLSSYSSKITVPTEGTKVKASDFNIWDNTITAIEKVCPNYSKYSKYGAYGEYGAYSVYSHYDYTAYGNYYQYSNYSQNQ